MGRIVFTTLGSLGDLYPMLPVANRLRERGHRLVFAVQDHLAPAVEGEGFAVSHIKVPSFPGPGASTSVSAVEARIKERLPSLIDGAMAALDEACRGADLLVSHHMQIAAAMTARKLRMPWVTLTMFPGFIPSAYTVPQPHWLPALPTPAGRVVNRFTWSVFRFALRHLSGEVIDAALDAHGLARDDELFTPSGLSPYLTLVLSSPLYSRPQPDWPGHVKVVGYSQWDEPPVWTEPPELASFLADGPPPVLVTTSSAGERNSTVFFDAAAQALDGAHVRAILLLGRAAADLRLGPGARVGSGLIAWPYLPLSRVLPHSSMVVHHAGIGTTLSTLRYGLPAVAIPATFDQWYNAGRVKELGIGRVLEWKRFSGERLASELTKLGGNPRYRDRARELGARISLEDGAGRAADEIEALLGRLRPRVN